MTQKLYDVLLSQDGNFVRVHVASESIESAIEKVKRNYDFDGKQNLQIFEIIYKNKFEFLI